MQADEERDHNEARLTRRRTIARLGGLVAASLGAAGLDATLAAAAEGAGDGPAAVAAGLVRCVLAPEQTEGPFYVDGERVRRDIREGRPGQKLLLRTTVVDASTCKPIKGAAVDVWHCDAGGVYSGVGGNTGTFLRGIQRTDRNGLASFVTIFPGWYQGRTTHIHVKVQPRRHRRAHGPALLPRGLRHRRLEASSVQPSGCTRHAQRRRRDLSQRRQELAHPDVPGGLRRHRGGDHDGSASVLTEGGRGPSSTIATARVIAPVAANAIRTPALPSKRPARSGVVSAITAQARFITPITVAAEVPSPARAPTAKTRALIVERHPVQTTRKTMSASVVRRKAGSSQAAARIATATPIPCRCTEEARSRPDERSRGDPDRTRDPEREPDATGGEPVARERERHEQAGDTAHDTEQTR